MKKSKPDSEILDDIYFPEEKTSTNFIFLKMLVYAFLFAIVVILLFAFVLPFLFS